MVDMYGIPEPHDRRVELRRLASEFAGARSLVPPVAVEMLDRLASEFIAAAGLDMSLKGWVMVELNNAVWADTLASVPHERRILLLPQCLSRSGVCGARIDEIGLLCAGCGGCSIHGLEEKAAELGVMSIVAEGFTSAVSLVENRVVDAVIGVSCLRSLEKAFPLLIENAVPGVAVALNGDGCKDTDVDEDRVVEFLERYSSAGTRPMDYGYLSSTVEEWFSEDSLKKILLPGADNTSRIALEWMTGEGKRWRPYLLAATYLAIAGGNDLPRRVKLAAIAVECFHKASLVHDDIQDNDPIRYGEQTLWARHGTAIAINTGDILLGEGYRLLALCGDVGLVGAIAEAHTALCRGQGAELEWARSPHPFGMDFVLDVFRNKTVPAFDVSLALGVMCAGGSDELREILHSYADALGIAYQLKDDIEDFRGDGPVAPAPSSVLAAIFEQCPEESETKEILAAADLGALMRTEGKRHLLDAALERVERMAAEYRSMAFDSIEKITDTELKRLLFRVTERILK